MQRWRWCRHWKNVLQDVLVHMKEIPAFEVITQSFTVAARSDPAVGQQ